MKKMLSLFLLVVAFALPASAAEVASDTPQAPAVTAAAPAADAPAACSADQAEAVDTSLDALLETAPAPAEACYPAECPCPPGFKCRALCCI